MTAKQKFTIVIIAIIIFQIGFNIYSITNGNTKTAIFDGTGVFLGVLTGYYLFGRKKSSKKND
jgi:multidrug transporter EmrE-like cation transporter